LGYPELPVGPLEPPMFGQFGIVEGALVAAGVVVLAAVVVALLDIAADPPAAA
jgi:hypothetical protein